MKHITVTKPFLPEKDEFLKYIDEIWENQWLTNQGPLHERFAIELKQYLQVDQITLFVNGHLALDTAIKSLGLKGEVITTPFTFASTTHALYLNNITPVFCDINEEDLTVDIDSIESLITPKTTAILAVHVYGHPCHIEEIENIANRHNLKVIYDAAHCFGMTYNHQSICQYGDVSMLSLHATKLFHSIEGGALIYKNGNYKEIFDAYKNFGIQNEELISYVGGNAKMNELQAAMGLANLKYVDRNISERKKITLLYRELLTPVSGIKYFCPEKHGDIEYNFSYMPVLIDENIYGLSRDEVYIKLKDNNIYTRKYFYPLITQFACYQEQFAEISLPIAEKISKQILCLPIYNGLSLHDVKQICYMISTLPMQEGQKDV